MAQNMKAIFILKSTAVRTNYVTHELDIIKYMDIRNLYQAFPFLIDVGHCNCGKYKDPQIVKARVPCSAPLNP